MQGLVAVDPRDHFALIAEPAEEWQAGAKLSQGFGPKVVTEIAELVTGQPQDAATLSE